MASVPVALGGNTAEVPPDGVLTPKPSEPVRIRYMVMFVLDRVRVVCKFHSSMSLGISSGDVIVIGRDRSHVFQPVGEGIRWKCRRCGIEYCD